MKKCYKCLVVMPLSHFNINADKKDGYGDECKSCKKIYNRQHYLNNKKYYYDAAKNRKIISCEYIYEILEGSQCSRCGYRGAAALQFHHREPSKKLAQISKMSTRGYSIRKIKEEIEKCDIMCANCHFEETAIQRGWYKKHCPNNSIG